MAKSWRRAGWPVRILLVALFLVLGAQVGRLLLVGKAPLRPAGSVPPPAWAVMQGLKKLRSEPGLSLRPDQVSALGGLVARWFRVAAEEEAMLRNLSGPTEGLLTPAQVAFVLEQPAAGSAGVDLEDFLALLLDRAGLTAAQARAMPPPTRLIGPQVAARGHAAAVAAFVAMEAWPDLRLTPEQAGRLAPAAAGWLRLQAEGRALLLDMLALLDPGQLAYLHRLSLGRPEGFADVSDVEHAKDTLDALTRKRGRGLR